MDGNLAMAEPVNAAFAEQLAQRDARIAELESRLDNQEESLRHMLTMLIEWLEEDGAQNAA